MTKRFDYLEELLRNWERNSSIPKIYEMLKKVFDYAEEEERSRRKELELQQKMYDQSLRKDKVTKYDNYMLKENWKKERKRILELLDRITQEKPRFGKSYYKIEIEQNDLENLKQVLRKEP